MYPVSSRFLEAIQRNTREFYYSGTITSNNNQSYHFDNSNIVKGSGYLTNQCSGNEEIEIGTAYVAEFGISLYTEIDRYTLFGAKVEVYFNLKIDSDTYESIPLGIFEISEANRSVHCIEIKAYDYMLRFEEDFTETSLNGTPYELLSLACKSCKVELAQTQSVIEALPNGMLQMGLYVGNDIETWRDVIYYICQALGSFATINRSGKLELRQYGTKVVQRFRKNDDIPVNSQILQPVIRQFVFKTFVIICKNIML